MKFMSYHSFIKMGLNKFQAKILYNLIKLKEAKASDLTKITDISRVRVYDILKELYSMGIIKKIEGRPSKYIAYSPKDTLEKIIEYKKQSFEKQKENILKNKKKITKELEKIYNKKQKESPQNILELISLGEISEKETKNILKKAKKEIKIMSESLEYIDSIYKVLKKSKAKVKVLLKKDPKSKKTQAESIEKLNKINAKIKFFETMPLRGTIIDKRQAIINIRDEKSSNLLRDCIHTNHNSFLEALNLYFNNIWDKSK